MAKLLLVIKGPAASARREAARRGVPIKVKRTLSHGELTAETACSNHRKVMNWFGRQRSTVKMGRGYPPGELLWFNPGACDAAGELGRASHRRRRRRR